MWYDVGKVGKDAWILLGVCGRRFRSGEVPEHPAAPLASMELTRLVESGPGRPMKVQPRSAPDSSIDRGEGGLIASRDLRTVHTVVLPDH